MVGPLDSITIVRATWDGAARVRREARHRGRLPGLARDRTDRSRVAARRRPLRRLGGFGDVYVPILVAGGRFPRRTDDGYIVMRRGPMLPGVDDEQIASLSRELMRSLGSPEPEP
jgi:hypothetical protein